MPMTVGKAIKKAQQELSSREVRYVKHERFPDDVFVITYLTESGPDENFQADRIHWEYRMDVYVGEHCINGIRLLSGWKDENEITPTVPDTKTRTTKTKRKPIIRTNKSAK